ncbi:MAG: glycosyltransferase family 4 protein [Tannerella sp.]|jgi:glycosyltransferase involved in cell wall biosynthesis|nr:glycosyltransferase family 4 protein [Tannerella sp.]
MTIPEKKPKIVVTGTRGIPGILGGVETHCEELFPRIAEKGYDVTVIRRKNYVKDRLTSYKGVSLFDVPDNKKKSFEAILHTFRAIWAAKWKLRAEVVHIHAVGPAILTPFARLLGMKVVFTHHGPDYDREKWGKAAKCMLRFGERMGCTFANEVIVISNVINDIIKQKYGRRDASLIYNGVSAPVTADNATYLKELGIEAHKYIFAMGRFVPEKNFHLLIQAFLSLHQSEYKLVIAGDADIEDDYSRKLKSSANKNGVVLTGFIKGSKLHTLLSYAGLFVIPSSHEGLPISLLEAMSYGLPVLASDIPANKEVNLPSSCYFRYNDSVNTNLSEALIRKMNEKTKPSYDLSPYNWDKIAKQTTEVYRKTMKNVPGY